jgi:hypothetical protein
VPPWHRLRRHVEVEAQRRRHQQLGVALVQVNVVDPFGGDRVARLAALAALSEITPNKYYLKISKI